MATANKLATAKQIVMYSTSACSLCEEMLDALLIHPLMIGVNLTVVDIATDDNLVDQFGQVIPVLRIQDNLYHEGVVEPQLSEWLTQHLSH